MSTLLYFVSACLRLVLPMLLVFTCLTVFQPSHLHSYQYCCPSACLSAHPSIDICSFLPTHSLSCLDTHAPASITSIWVPQFPSLLYPSKITSLILTYLSTSSPTHPPTSPHLLNYLSTFPPTHQSFCRLTYLSTFLSPPFLSQTLPPSHHLFTPDPRTWNPALLWCCRSDGQATFFYWGFQTITGLAGVLVTALIFVMYVFAAQWARRKVFTAFWFTHSLYPLVYVLTFLHGIGRLVQDPLFPWYLIGPLVIFVLDRLMSASRNRIEIPVIKAELLPSGMDRACCCCCCLGGRPVLVVCSSSSSSSYSSSLSSAAPASPLNPLRSSFSFAPPPLPPPPLPSSFSNASPPLPHPPPLPSIFSSAPPPPLPSFLLLLLRAQ